MRSENSTKTIIAGFAAAALILLTAVVLVLAVRENADRESDTDAQEIISGTVTYISEEAFTPVEETGEEEGSLSEDYESYPLDTAEQCAEVIETYANDHGIDILDYPVWVNGFLYNHHDALRFVLRYPELAGTQDEPDYPGTIDLTEDFSPVRMPEYYQYDERWGYKAYAGDIMAITGGGPTAFSMAATFLTGNSDLNPAWVAQYSENLGYAMDGGTSWGLMNDGATGLGIDVTPISADQDRVDRNLDVGNIVVCLMGEGDFAGTYQYIIIYGRNDNGYLIRDPGSLERTSREWSFDTLASQMRGCWIMRIL